MKKKCRDIVVDGIKYVWTLGKYNADGDGGIALNIWKDKKLIWKTECFHNITITPKIVKEVILQEKL